MAPVITSLVSSNPTEQLKSLGDADTVGAYAEALTRLFGLAQQQADKEMEEAAETARRSGRASAGSGRPELVEGRVEPFSRSKSRGPR